MHWRLLPPEEKPWIACKFMTSVMTTLFCDLQGFTSMSEGVTPQGLAKIMNRYLSTMSEPIRAQHGVIDKYIGDAIMAYWGPPFNVARTRRSLPVLPPLDMIARVSPLCAGLPEILGVRQCTTAGYSYRHSDR